MAYRRKTNKLTLPSSIVLLLGGVDRLAGFSFGVISGEILSHARQDYRIKRELREIEIKERKKFKQALRRLELAEEITFNKKENEYRLTTNGWLKFVKYYNKYNKKGDTKTGEKGDYIIMFDIPEKHRRFRDLFRSCLVNLGCQYIQKSNFYTNNRSVFVFAQKMVANCELSEYVKFVEAKEIF